MYELTYVPCILELLITGELFALFCNSLFDHLFHFYVFSALVVATSGAGYVKYPLLAEDYCSGNTVFVS